jgi:cellulose synthase/poly-beta-1,6-N-acetylglucosamine synthase-like glycosyltransferase
MHRSGAFLPQSHQQRPDEPRAAPAAVQVIRATKEASASHARNVGAAHAHNQWLLFLDSDVQPPADLIELFFSEPIGDGVGAITGDIAGIPDTRTLAARYGTARNFLGQRSHVMNPFRPRASSANLLVRRAAFEQVHGYTEGIWAAEDTDFTWRLQAAGWTLAFNPQALVQHAYRDSLRALGRQWRGYAAGAMWLSQQYPDFELDPGLNRMVRRLLKRVGIGPGVAFRADGRSSAASQRLSRWQRLQFLFVDCYLGVQEKLGHRQSNRVTRREP